jgi:hypothetical protein
MMVIYRLCGIPSTNPSPVFQEDKFRLNKLCLKSFVEAFKKVNPYVYFILDNCGAEYIELLEQEVPFEFDFEMTNLGINNTMLHAYELARDQDQDILFQECDYLYLPDTGPKLVEAVEELGLVSPYDHLNFYLDKTLHSNQVALRLVGDHHWRTTERNTMTFAVKNEVFKKNYDVFYHYGYLDGQVWYDLLSKGHPLWTPIPSLATHMVKDFLSPGVNWHQYFSGPLEEGENHLC